MYSAMQSLRQNDVTKRVGTLWSNEEEVQLLRELSGKMSYEEISRIHQRTVRGIIARRNHMIRNEMKKNGCKEDLYEKYNISEMECEMILSAAEQQINKTVVKKSKKEVQEERIVRLENEVKEMNKTLSEIRDYLKLLTISYNVNQKSSNPFDE
jgi:DNA gyrase/topoisomerase IV subunit A